MAKIEYEIEKSVREEMIYQMLDIARGKERKAIDLYLEWCEAGQVDPEPEVSDLVSWKIECAISSDFAHLYREKLPEGVFGSQYEHGYVRIKQENARKAAKRREEREKSRAFRNGDLSGPDLLRSMLTIKF